MADSIMDSLIYSLNATVPVFVVIVVGYLLKRIGWINQGFIEASNKINFKVTLPALLIQDMVNNNFMEKFELGYCHFLYGWHHHHVYGHLGTDNHFYER